MTTEAFSALLGRQSVYSNSLATIIADCVIIRDFEQRSHINMPLEDVWKVTIVSASHMPLAVFATGFFVVAAAAKCSRNGSGAEILIMDIHDKYLSRETEVPRKPHRGL
jgi:hypothetical protein